MKKIINKLIDEFTKGVDTYTHVGSTWLIFTESKQWVIELTESKTLWYNYNFFKGMFNYVSMDVVENQHYITKWVEDNVINKNQVNLTKNKMSDFVSDSLIRDGVKRTSSNVMIFQSMKVEDTIQNGVKDTLDLKDDYPLEVDEVIQDGVKETRLEMNITEGEVDDIIQDGVKLTQFNDNENKSWVEGVIKKGIKETNHVDVMGFFNNKMEDTLQNGVRHTLNTEYMPTSMVQDIIENGVKETKVEKRDGIKDTKIEETIQNGVKEIKYSTYDLNDCIVKDVIKEGVKETLRASYLNVDDVIDNGVKEIKTPNKDGDIVPFAEWMKENNSSSYTKMIDEVIESGVKKTMLRQHITDGNVETIIETGIKEVQPLPDQSGELIGYGNYYHGKEDRAKAFIDYIEETIKFGVKENIG
jgi:hypothetical protein